MAPLKSQKYIFNMETDDPDDFITLLIMLGHPRVELLGVIVTPGSPEQVALVKEAMKWFGKDLPVASLDISHTEAEISPWHYRMYGAYGRSFDTVSISDILKNAETDVTFFSGAPLTAVAKGLNETTISGQFGRLVAQGGFAGNGVVPDEFQLDKFKGQATCSSYNLSHDTDAADFILNSDAFIEKYFVSKNVCHGIYYDAALHLDVLKNKDRHLYLEKIYQGMTDCEGSSKKKYHDPFALCCAIDPDIALWEEVMIFRDGPNWGCYNCPETKIFITVSYEHSSFLDTLLGY